jgi:hypothetical protein
VTDAPGAALGQDAVISPSSTSVFDLTARAGDKVNEAIGVNEAKPVANETYDDLAPGVLIDSPIQDNRARTAEQDDRHSLREGDLLALHPVVADELVPIPDYGIVDPFYLVGADGETWAINAVTGSSVVIDKHTPGIAILTNGLRGPLPVAREGLKSNVCSINDDAGTSAPAALKPVHDNVSHFVQPGPDGHHIDPSFELLLFDQSHFQLSQPPNSSATPSTADSPVNIGNAQDVLHTPGLAPQVYTSEPTFGEAQQTPLDQHGPAYCAPTTWNYGQIDCSYNHIGNVPPGPVAHSSNYSTYYQAPGFAPPTVEQMAAYAHFDHPHNQHWSPNIASPTPAPLHQPAPIVSGPGVALDTQQYPYMQLQYCNEYNNHPYVHVCDTWYFT